MKEIKLKKLDFAFAVYYTEEEGWALTTNDEYTHQIGKLGLIVVKVCSFCLGIAYIAHQHHPYIESLLTLIANDMHLSAYNL